MSVMKKTEYFAISSDGTKIRYLIWSAGTATKKLVLVHSLAMTADFWDATAKAIGPHLDVLAIDCRGHGLSDKPRGLTVLNYLLVISLQFSMMPAGIPQLLGAHQWGLRRTYLRQHVC